MPVTSSESVKIQVFEEEDTIIGVYYGRYIYT